MKKAGRKRLKLEREAVKVLMSVELMHIQGGHTSCILCTDCSCYDATCRSTEEGVA